MTQQHSRELPQGWSWATIGEVTHLKVDQSGPHGSDAFTYLDIGGIDNQLKQIVDPKSVAVQDAPSRARQSVRSGDVLVSMTRPNLNAVAMVPKHLDLAIASTGFDVLRAIEVVPSWLLLVVQGTDFIDAMCRLVQGALYPAVRPKNIRSYRLPIPPYQEQQRIVAKIEELFSELDAGVAALKRVQANLKRYRSAVLKAAVEGRLSEAWRADHSPAESGAQLLDRILKERRQRWEKEQLAAFAAAEKDPPKNWQAKYKEPTAPDTTNLPPLPEGWCWASIDQLQARLKNGFFQSPTQAESGTPILRINAVRPMSVDLSEARLLGDVGAEVDDYCIQNGDLLFTRYNGSVDLLGVAGMVRGCTSKVVHPDKLIRVCLVVGAPLPNYVEIAANTGESRRHMAGRARTTAGQTGISGPDVREMPVPLPPLTEQRVIVDSVEQALSAIRIGEAEVDRGLIRAARLRRAILQQAFEGKLVAQDAADEPASVLLARIKQQRMAVPSSLVDKAKKPGKLPREVFLRRASVVSYTVRRLSAHKSFGRTQLEKTVHLTQSHLGVDLGFVFERYAAGPFDKDIYKLEAVAKKNDWFSTQNRPKFGVTYHPGGKIDQMCQYASGHLGDRQADLDRLLDHIAGMNTDDAELFATAYAAWNDLLIDGRPDDDGAIIAEVHGWHEQKKKFTPDVIRHRLQWMRQNGYVPTGQGQRTRLVEKATKLDSRRRKKGDASA